MKLEIQMNLSHYLYVYQILVRERAMVEKIEIQEIENMTFILVNKREI